MLPAEVILFNNCCDAEPALKKTEVFKVLFAIQLSGLLMNKPWVFYSLTL